MRRRILSAFRRKRVELNVILLAQVCREMLQLDPFFRERQLDSALFLLAIVNQRPELLDGLADFREAHGNLPVSLAISLQALVQYLQIAAVLDRKSTRLNSSHSQISYAVFCLKKKKSRYVSQ